MKEVFKWFILITIGTVTWSLFRLDLYAGGSIKTDEEEQIMFEMVASEMKTDLKKLPFIENELLELIFPKHGSNSNYTRVKEAADMMRGDRLNIALLYHKSCTKALGYYYAFKIEFMKLCRERKKKNLAAIDLGNSDIYYYFGNIQNNLNQCRVEADNPFLDSLRERYNKDIKEGTQDTPGGVEPKIDCPANNTDIEDFNHKMRLSPGIPPCT
ncbi:MAG: hypothetical protein HQK53_08895 [Oligoflexia bacterium]|nr:hypothetical protein [Oligoflexia bacterium]